VLKRIIATALAMLLSLAAPVHAQYFGRNKVQYDQFRFEVLDAFQRDILHLYGRSLASLPLWFAEGMAEALSVGRLDTNTRMWLRDTLANGQLPTLAQLDNPKSGNLLPGLNFWRANIGVAFRW